MSVQQHLSLINKQVNTVKDIPSSVFIEVFANHLKKSNKFKIPDVSEIDWQTARIKAGAFCQFLILPMISNLIIFNTRSGPNTLRLPASRNCPPTPRTGSTPALPPSLTNST